MVNFSNAKENKGFYFFFVKGLSEIKCLAVRTLDSESKIKVREKVSCDPL